MIKSRKNMKNLTTREGLRPIIVIIVTVGVSIFLVIIILITVINSCY